RGRLGPPEAAGHCCKGRAAACGPCGAAGQGARLATAGEGRQEPDRSRWVRHAADGRYRAILAAGARRSRGGRAAASAAERYTDWLADCRRDWPARTRAARSHRTNTRTATLLPL